MKTIPIVQRTAAVTSYNKYRTASVAEVSRFSRTPTAGRKVTKETEGLFPRAHKHEIPNGSSHLIEFHERKNEDLRKEVERESPTTRFSSKTNLSGVLKIRSRISVNRKSKDRINSSNSSSSKDSSSSPSLGSSDNSLGHVVEAQLRPVIDQAVSEGAASAGERGGGKRRGRVAAGERGAGSKVAEGTASSESLADITLVPVGVSSDTMRKPIGVMGEFFLELGQWRIRAKLDMKPEMGTWPKATDAGVPWHTVVLRPVAIATKLWRW